MVGIDESGHEIVKAIEDIKVGDYVISRDQSDRDDDVSARRVTNTFRRTSDHLRHLRFTGASGHTEALVTTDEHPFWVDGIGWVQAATLRPGMVVAGVGSPDGSLLVVTDSIREDRPEGVIVFNFEVEGDHTYFVEDGSGQRSWVWANNACGSYAQVKGHHIHIKSGFRGAQNYSESRAWSTSQDGMRALHIDHVKVTTAQRRLYTEFALSGKKPSWPAYNAIEVRALMEGGASFDAAWVLVAKSQKYLKDLGVWGPTRIPWH